ncbi:GIY-YIG nuclease family protein [Galbitalea sp. SE-J8]|uniref:GIY-YIG nuclease family protein n=1 Tax=Galbitalea sp. SE-J8 TaxID=3054952 RepID=UPI00259CF682|nr:GIY-YIG nuclease family protein [Galbitalea sp. SE-J8]MDM4762083.1 GIY-YIG nuclease family protein [Galbitalea sp. SE-J8]
MPPDERCVAPGCDARADAGSPVPLCALHAIAVHDHVGAAAGAADLLPSPCLLCGGRVGIRYPSGAVCADCGWVYGDVPDADLPPPRIDVVYYVRFGDRVKIGTSANPRQRLAVLPVDELLAFERGARALEQRRHAEFASARLGTSEWFAATRELLAHAADLAGGVDPWTHYARWLARAVALRG